MTNKRLLRCEATCSGMGLTASSSVRPSFVSSTYSYRHLCCGEMRRSPQLPAVAGVCRRREKALLLLLLLLHELDLFRAPWNCLSRVRGFWALLSSTLHAGFGKGNFPSGSRCQTPFHPTKMRRHLIDLCVGEYNSDSHVEELMTESSR